MGRVARWVGLSGWRAGLAVTATAAGALLVVAALAGGRGGGRRLMPGPGGTMPQIIGFYENGWSSIFRSSFSSVRAHANVIDTVLAFWYSVDGSGTLQAHQPNASVTQWVKQHGMRMGVLVNNVGGGSGNNAGMLTDPTARTAAVRAIRNLVQADGYQEVNIDFEMLNPSARGGMVSFMQQLRTALPTSVSLSASVFPKIGVPASLNGAYDYTQLAKYVNYLVIMLYDNHSSGGPSGPVSPWPWVVQNMNWFLHTAKIPASKLVLAAGVYGYDWPAGSTTAAELPLTAINSLAKSTGATVHVDAASKNPYFRYTAADGTAHVVWFQDKETVVQRLQLAQKLHLHGVAIWALGEETPAVWSGIVETWGTK
jgi:spore germination protein YaaH